MDPQEAERLVREVRAWARKGLIPPASVPALEADVRGRIGAPEPAPGNRPAEGDGSAEGAGFGAVALYSLAGALAAAAVVALLAFADASEGTLASVMGGVGVLGAAGALLLRRLGAGAAVWSEPLGVAGVVGLAIAPFPSDAAGHVFVWLALLAGLALPFAAGRYSPLPVLGPALFTLAGFRVMDLYFAEAGFIFDDYTDAGATLWLVMQAALTAAIVGGGAILRPRWWSGASGACAILLVAPLLAFIGIVVQPEGEGIAELAVAVPEAILLGIGLAMGLRGLVIGSALVIAGDAIVFAFDVGGEIFGTFTLLAVAGAMIALATVLRRRMREPDRNGPPRPPSMG